MAGPVVVPNDVLAFLSAAADLRDRSLRINPLTTKESAEQSAALQDVDVARTLNLVVLDDANDSNPYCYIGAGPARGMVVHFSHDPEPQIRFHSLTGFLESLRAARGDGRDIDELEYPALRPLDDQRALVRRIRELLEGSDESATLQLGVYVPLLAPDDLQTLRLCASNVDFLIREIAAVFIQNHSRAQHRDMAQRLAIDPYAQVAGPARMALAMLDASLTET